jgi:hemerythrin-like domain-containing protein
MRIKQPTRTTSNAFRLDVEHYLARAITGQLAKTLEELDAEDADRKAKRAAAAKARKAKKNA